VIQALRRHLLAASVPITKWVGRVHAPFSHKRVQGLHVVEALKVARPGHVLMSRTLGELTNLFIPGFWSHGAIYAGDAWVLEAVGDGVRLTDLVTFMTTKDYVAICAPRFATEEQQGFAAAWARQQLGRPYDYAFSSGNKAFYCFELTYAAYQAATGNASPWTLRPTLGVDTVVGDDLERAKDKWEFVFDSRRKEVIP
jgi:hypothetical protein